MSFKTKDLTLLVLVLLVGKAVAQDRDETHNRDNITYLRGKVDSLQQSVDLLWSTINLHSEKLDEVSINNTVYLDISSTEFQIFRTSLGQFPIILENIEEYIDGFKVYLKIGNPSYMQIAGYTLDVEWGIPPDYSDTSVNLYQIYRKWKDSLHSKEFSPTTELEAGSWTEVMLIFPSTSKVELGHIAISMSAERVRLKRTNP